MRGTKWQFSLFFFILSTFIISIVNAESENEKDLAKSTTTTASTTTTLSQKQNSTTTTTTTSAIQTTTINNCLASLHHTKFTTSTKLPHTKTVYVCKTPNAQVTQHSPIRTADTHSKKKKTTTTTKKHSAHKSIKAQSKDGKSEGKKHTWTKKTTTRKHNPHKTKKTTTTTTKKKTTKKSTKKITTKKSTTKKSTTKKSTTKKTTTTTTKKSTTVKPTQTHEASVTSTTEIALVATPTVAPTTAAVDTNRDASSNPVPNEGSAASPNDDGSPASSNDEGSPASSNDDGSAASSNDEGSDASANDEGSNSTPDESGSTTSPNENGSQTTPAPIVSTTPDNQVNAQSVETTQTTENTPQSKVIGVSVGAVVGCIAAAGLAGMFIYKRREKTHHDQDVEDMNQTSEVNTRWRTQSFMAVVAGAVAKLPKRSNSSASSNGGGGGVLGSIRRAASNASRSLSVRSKGSTRSSVQSYGIAVSGPIPAIARIDGDQARYYNEPESPTHTHAY